MARENEDGPELQEYVAQHLGAGLDLEARIDGVAYDIREASKRAYPQALLDARLQILAIVETALDARSGTPGVAGPDTSDRLVITASFLQGVVATEGLISEGQYAKAAAALKQDLEMLARVGETIAGTVRRGATPNVRYAPTGSGRIYGRLNDVAHPSDPDLLADLLGRHITEEVRGVSYVPAFVKSTAVALYGIHVWLLFEMCREVLRLLKDLYVDDVALRPLERWWLAIARQLVAGGHLAEQPVNAGQ